MLVRRDGETLNALLKRLDRAIGAYYADGGGQRPLIWVRLARRDR